MKKRSIIFAVAMSTMVVVACGGSGSTQAFCDKIQELEDNDPTEGLDPTSTEFFRAMTDSFQELEDAAPSEIKDDVAAVVGTFDGMLEQVESGEEVDFVALSEEMAAAEEQFDRVDAFVDANCEGG